MFLLDTNICIYLMKNTYPALTASLLAKDPPEIMISSVTVFELEYGSSKSNWGERTRSNLYAFLSPFTVLPFDAKDAVTAGQIRAYLVKLGTPIGPYDLQIAAQGLARDLTVITHNTSEFSRIPGLRMEDWTI